MVTEDETEVFEALSTVDEIDEESSLDLTPVKPNRDAFQRELRILNDHIGAIRKKVHSLLDPNDSHSIIAAKSKTHTIRQKKDEMGVQSRVVKTEVEALRKRLADVKNEIQEKESGCRIKSLDRIDLYLKQAEERYNTKNLGRREEQIVVDEIDTLRRNRNNIEKIQDLHKEKVKLEAEIVVKKQLNAESYRSLMALKNEEYTSRNERKVRVEYLHRVKQDMSRLYTDRRKLIEEYNKSRGDYRNWVKTSKKPSSSNGCPATFPNFHRNRNCSFSYDHEDEELEPFYEQKRDCKRLIGYLERLSVNVDIVPTKNIISSTESESDSADEFPAAFAKMNISPVKTMKKPENKRVKNHRKIKATQPLSHSYDIYNLFGTVDVEVPVTYQDIPKTLKQVQDRLAFFEQETNIIDWDEELKGMGSLLPISRTVSEFTDSACPDSASECASLVSTRNRSGMDSPSIRVESPAADEGLSSSEVQPRPPVVNGTSCVPS